MKSDTDETHYCQYESPLKGKQKRYTKEAYIVTRMSVTIYGVWIGN
jgi:hypothetical protein